MAWELIFFLATLTAVSVGCLLPAGWLPPLPNDKLLHFGAYAGLALLALRLAHGWTSLACWLGGLLLASWLIEVLQNLVPGRAFCWRDMAANAAGVAAAACCAPLLLPSPF
jgi:VanZ family protein